MINRKRTITAAVILLTAAVMFTAGCTGTSASSGIEGTWVSSEPSEDKALPCASIYVVLSLYSDGTGFKVLEYDNSHYGPIFFNWYSNGDGTYTASYTDEAKKQFGVPDSFKLMMTDKRLIDSERIIYTKSSGTKKIYGLWKTEKPVYLAADEEGYSGYYTYSYRIRDTGTSTGRLYKNGEIIRTSHLFWSETDPGIYTMNFPHVLENKMYLSDNFFVGTDGEIYIHDEAPAGIVGTWKIDKSAYDLVLNAECTYSAVFFINGRGAVIAYVNGAPTDVIPFQWIKNDNKYKAYVINSKNIYSFELNGDELLGDFGTRFVRIANSWENDPFAGNWHSISKADENNLMKIAVIIPDGSGIYAQFFNTEMNLVPLVWNKISENKYTITCGSSTAEVVLSGAAAASSDGSVFYR